MVMVMVMVMGAAAGLKVMRETKLLKLCVHDKQQGNGQFGGTRGEETARLTYIVCSRVAG